jgi:hypothetical protein
MIVFVGVIVAVAGIVARASVGDLFLDGSLKANLAATRRRSSNVHRREGV